MPMTPRSGMSIMWTVIFGMSLDAAELVELHVRVDLPAGDPVEDALLEQGVVQAHDDAAGDLRLAGQLVDEQAAVLHGDHVRDADHAGLGSPPAPRRSARRRPGRWRCSALPGSLEIAQAPLARALGLVHAEPGAELLPRPAPCLSLRVHDLAGLDRQVLRVGAELRARPSRRGRRAPPAPPAASPAPATGRWCCRRSRSSGRSWLSPIFTIDVGRLQAEDFGDDDGGHRPLGGAEVLRGGLGGDAAVAADDDGTLVRRVPPAANPPQVCRAMPMPCLTVPPLPLPGGCHFSFQPDSLTARSSCSL